MKILLDTNAYSALRRKHETIAELVREAEEVLLSTVVVGELLSGFRNGSRYEANVRGLAEFLEDPNVRLLPVTWETQAFFGALAGRRAKKGVFITTSSFTKEARAYGQQVSEGVVLIDSSPGGTYL